MFIIKKHQIKAMDKAVLDVFLDKVEQFILDNKGAYLVDEPDIKPLIQNYHQLAIAKGIKNERDIVSYILECLPKSK